MSVTINPFESESVTININTYETNLMMKHNTEHFKRFFLCHT